MKILNVIANDNHTEIEVEFIKNGKKAMFSYDLVNSEIMECSYDEDDKDDIYEEIHNWRDKHINFETSIKFDGKEL